jgi:hypothetical protein
MLIIPDLQGHTNTDFTKIDSLIEAGYIATKEKIPEILHRLKGLSHQSTESDSSSHIISDPTNISECPVQNPNRLQIQGINVVGNNITSFHLVKTASGISEKDSINSYDLSKIITSLYSTGLFENVNVEIDSLKNLRIMVEEKKYLRVRSGLRYDDFHLGEGYIQPAYENLFGLGICALLHLQYGLRREKYSIELLANHLFTTNFAYNLLAQLYISKDRFFEREIVSDDTSNTNLILL